MCVHTCVHVCVCVAGGGVEERDRCRSIRHSEDIFEQLVVVQFNENFIPSAINSPWLVTITESKF